MQAASKGDTGRFLVAYLMSAFGYEFIFFSMTIYVYEVSKSPFMVGVFAALTFAPRLFAPLYGVAVDRYSRPRVFGVAAGITGALVAAMTFQPTLGWIYPVWTLTAILLTTIVTVRAALMTELMAQDSYLRGNSLVLVMLNIAKVLAPLLAGLASVAMSSHALFYMTAGLYFAVALISSSIKSPLPVSGRAGRNLAAELKEGIGYLWRQADLRQLISLAVLWRLLIGLQVSLFVVYVKTYLGGGDTEYGMFMTAIGIGSILGSVVGPWLVKRVAYPAVVAGGMVIHYASFVVLGLVRDYQTALVVAFLSYIVFYATLVSLHSLRDRATQVELRGRVYGSVTAILTPPAIVSMLAGGYLANVFGVENVFVIAGVLAIVSFGFLSLAKGFVTPEPGRLTD
jgi:DHA3 family macrolide efflux protein-like MFS transporter